MQKIVCDIFCSSIFHKVYMYSRIYDNLYSEFAKKYRNSPFDQLHQSFVIVIMVPKFQKIVILWNPGVFIWASSRKDLILSPYVKKHSRLSKIYWFKRQMANEAAKS